MTDYYEVLGIHHGCSATEIKKSFRKKAKQMHPDLKSQDETQAEDRMRFLLKAYEVLIDPESRAEYDRALAQHYAATDFDYRDYLSRKKDPFNQAKLIFHDLLHNNRHEALVLYQELVCHTDFYLEDYLSREDYMDCAFLLAETFESEGQYISALELYKKIYMFEIQKPYFHHFIDEVIERLRNIVCFKMQGIIEPPLLVGYLENMIDLNLSRKYTAFFCKKIAEIYSSLGQNETAKKYLHQGLQLNKKLSGVKKLKEKIGYENVHVG